MSNSSQPKNSLDTYLNDVFIVDSDISTIDLSNITMNSTNDYVTSGDTITITSGNLSSYNITTDTPVWSWGDSIEWSDSFPDWHRVQDMCKEYPGLEIALKNFQTIYTLVKDDYDNPRDKK